ncbi:MAG: InlB B-repeat-containing protein, partial [Clostridia bacterium]|nr:InlB B-repeat-containing protein [Clostridia bacterium]
MKRMVRKSVALLVSLLLVVGTVPIAFAADTYSISYDLGGGSVSGNPTSYDVNTSPVRLNNPTRLGYTFTGWTGSNGATPSTQVDTPNVLSSGISYSTGSPYTANLRDHILGNDFTVLPGMTYRVFVTAKRTSGSLNMQGGIWYTGGSQGDPWEGYSGSFTYLRDAGDGWGVYYKDIAVPSGKQQGKFYIQIDQANSGGDTTWLIANCYVTAYFEPLDVGLSYTTSNPYTCSLRDHIIGNGIPVTVGQTYRVYVTARRTAGSLSLNGGLWYYDNTSGDPWDSVSGAFTLIYNIGDGWGRYYKDVTVPAGKVHGQPYFQIEQSHSGVEGNVWQVADVAVVHTSLSNLSYKANWQINTYNIGYTLNGGSVSGNPSTYTVETSPVRLNNPTKTGYTFTGWTGSNGAAPSTDVTVPNGVSSGLSGYTVSAPYTAAGRDHVFGNSFPVISGATYRVYVTAKRTAGSLPMQGGIAYSAGQTAGAWYDGVGGAFTYLRDAGDGWGVYYKDVTVPAGKQRGQFYIQMDQAGSGGSTTWLIANGSVTTLFVPFSLGLDGYTTSAPYTCAGRDHVTGNSFPVEVGKTYTVLVTAKQTAGSLPMQGGIAYSAGQTAGEWYDGVGGAFTYLGDAGNGWGRYYKNVTVPAGKQRGQIYIQMEQWDASATTTWQVAEMAVIESKVADLAYTANWTPNTYTISFDGNGASSGSTASVGATYDADAVLTANGFVKTGYSFAGWAASADGNAVYGNGATVRNLTAAQNGSVTLFAKWTANPYTLTVDVNGGDAYTGNINASYIIGQTETIVEPTRTGYHFTGWTVSAGTLTNGVYTFADSDATLTANWEINTYTVTFVDGYTNETIGTDTAQHGSAANAPTPAAYHAIAGDTEKHMKYTGWDKSFDNVTGALTVTALYEEEAHDAWSGYTNNGETHSRTCEHCGFIETEAHNYALTGWSWNENHTSATATFTCGKDSSHVETVTDDEIDVETISEQTCETDHVVTYTASVEFLGNTYTGKVENVKLDDRTGHAYALTGWSWNEGHTAATATFTCGNNAAHVETVTDEDPDAETVSEQTCVAAHIVTYTASVAFEGETYTNKAENVTVAAPSGIHTPVGTERIDATCTEKGNIEYYTCEVCGKIFTEEACTNEITAEETVLDFDYTNHSTDERVTKNAKEAKCNEDGYTGDIYCAACDHEVTHGSVIAKETIAHTPVKTDEKAATCTEKGNIEYYTCSVCGKIFTEESCDNEISAEQTVIDFDYTNHSTDERVTKNAKEAKCNEDGYTGDIYCAACDHEITHGSVIAKESIAHTPVKTDEKAATCTEKGNIEYYTCSVCGKIFTEEACENEITAEQTILDFDYTNHSTTETVTKDAKDATCNEDGYTGDIYCAACDHLIEAGEAIPSGGTEHVFGAWYVKTAPGCTEEGVEERDCENCGESETRPIAATGHSFGEWFDDEENGPTCGKDGIQHRVCAKCGEAETREVTASEKGHSIRLANEEGEGYCADCGQYRCLFCEKDEHMHETNDASVMTFFIHVVHYFYHLFSNFRYT